MRNMAGAGGEAVTKRILIVDDDPDLVEAVSLLLQGRGMEAVARGVGGMAVRFRGWR